MGLGALCRAFHACPPWPQMLPQVADIMGRAALLERGEQGGGMIHSEEHVKSTHVHTHTHRCTHTRTRIHRWRRWHP